MKRINRIAPIAKNIVLLYVTVVVVAWGICVVTDEPTDLPDEQTESQKARENVRREINKAVGGFLDVIVYPILIVVAWMIEIIVFNPLIALISLIVFAVIVAVVTQLMGVPRSRNGNDDEQ